MGEWDGWIGRSLERQDRVDEALLQRWAATLDRDPPADDRAPQGIHWCLCTPDAPTARLGSDGHPRRTADPGSLLPPVPLPRRMWASSQVAFHAPLRAGDRVRLRSRIKSVTEKHGSSGRLVFVDVHHETFAADTLAVDETQTLVYRDAAPPDAPLSPPPLGADTFDRGAWPVCRDVLPSEALLFRYSALTFNSHRIHYDAPYATAEERYRGLVVHGPLTATWLLDLARREFGEQALSRFAFRGLSPAVLPDPLRLVLRHTGRAVELGAFASDGRQVMTATAELQK